MHSLHTFNCYFIATLFSYSVYPPVLSFIIDQMMMLLLLTDDGDCKGTHVGYAFAPADVVVQLLTGQQLIYLAVQITYALQFLHQQSICHKDVAARNCT